MGVDFLYLEAVRDSSVADVREAITRVLTGARSTWKLCGPSEGGNREIRIATRGGWTVVAEQENRLPVRWADKLSAALGAVAVSARSWTDDGSIELRLYEAGRERGAVDGSVLDDPSALHVPFAHSALPSTSMFR